MKRDIQIDLIRAVSMFFVVAVHALPHVFLPKIIDSFLSLIFYSANGLFFMISGYLNLKQSFCTTTDYKNYFYKKFVTLFIPFFIISFWIFLSSNGYHVSLDFFKDFIRAFLSNNIYYHLWFMYVLIGFTAVTPFISKLVNNMSKLDIEAFFIIALIWNTLSAIICEDLLSISFGFQGWIFSEYLFYYVASYLIEKLEIKNYKHIYFTGIMSLFVSTIQLYLYPEKLIFNLSPLHAVTIVSIYLFIKNTLIINSDILNNIIKNLAPNTFAVYLVHAKILDIVDYYFPKPNNRYALYIYLVCCTFVISFLLSIALNKLLFKPIQKMLLNKQ